MVVFVTRERYVGKIQTQTRLWMNVYNGDDKALTVTVKSVGGPDYHKYLAATLRDVRSLQIPEPVCFFLVATCTPIWNIFFFAFLVVPVLLMSRIHCGNVKKKL